jgi:hypothetical protein
MEMPSNKKFGWFFCGIFALVATYASFNNIFLLSKISFSILFLLLITTVFFSSKLDPLNKLWFNIGITLGKFVSPIILGALFFLLVSPIAITSRWFGRDELLIKKRKINTYWISRETDEPSNFKDQF